MKIRRSLLLTITAFTLGLGVIRLRQVSWEKASIYTVAK